jgi:hypothetical protein
MKAALAKFDITIEGEEVDVLGGGTLVGSLRASF